MNPKVIGQRLAILRGQTPQITVAKAVGISVSALSMYENGIRIPRDEVKVRIAEYYKKSIQDIFFAN